MLLLLLACDDTTFPAPPGGEVVSGNSYADVQQVFASKCLGCHSAAAKLGSLDLETDACAAIVDVESANYPGNTLVVPGNSSASVLWNKCDDSGIYGSVMPQGGRMPQANIDTIQAWIDGGASCSGDSGGGGTTATVYSYQMVQERVFDAACVSCHSPGGDPDAEFLDLSAGAAYANIVGQPSSYGPDLIDPGHPESSYLLAKLQGSSINGERMPEGGQLSTELTALVYGWILEGAPQ